MKQLFTFSFFLLLYLNISAQSFDWRQMNSSLSAFIQHPSNPDILFAGDQAGLIRKSIDKGASWKLVSTQSESAILDIKFLNNTVGFAAVNEAGLFLMTTDGGNSWERKLLTDTANAKKMYSQYLKRIVIVDNETVLFDLYSHPISTVSAAEVIITKDGGQTFGILKAPGNVYHIAGDTLLAFGRELSSFTYKFTIYKSTNKGQSWSIHKMSPTGLSNFNNEGINLAFFLSSKVFYLTTNRTYSSDRQLYKTSDGGVTFSIVPPPVNNKFAAVYFKNEQEGVVVMDNNFTYYTANGGTNWTLSQRNVQPALYYLGNDQFMANVNGCSAISIDFGKTWKVQSNEVFNINSGNASTMSLNVVNDSLSFALLGRGGTVPSGFVLVKTTNGGLTWQNGTVDNQLPTNIFPAYIASADTFFHIGSGYKGTSGGYMKIKLTTDGGKTSTEMYTGEYQEGAKEMVFIDKLNAVTYSEFYAPNISSDGGKTWSRVTVTKNYTGTPVKMVFPGLNSWYLLSSDHKVYKSIDKGATWDDITKTMILGAGGTECNIGIYFINELTGFLHGCKGKLYKTTDGGESWIDIKPSLPTNIVNNNLYSLKFQDSNTGFTVDPSSNGQRVVMKTTDGGNTWSHYTGVQNYIGVNLLDFGIGKSGGMVANTGNYNRYFGNLVFKTDSIQLPGRVTGLGYLEEESSYAAIFPNPAKDLVNIVLSGGTDILSVKMLDITGRTVSVNKNEISEGKITLGTSNLQPGIYFIELETSKGIMKEKIVISN